MPLLTIGRNRQNAISVKETISVLHEEAFKHLTGAFFKSVTEDETMPTKSYPSYGLVKSN